MRVSVIIPTLNAGEELNELLKRLKSQSVPPFEMIVMDSESTDGTPKRALTQGARVYYVKRGEFDHGGTRNQAAAEASGDILMFMTQDAMPADERLIEELVKPLEQGTAAYAYARQLPDDKANLLERMSRENNYPQDSHLQTMEQIQEKGLRTFFCSNACAAIRRDVFDHFGGFEEPVIFNEDLFMAAQCVMSGKHVAYCADAKVYHSHNYSAMQQFKRFFDNGVSMSLHPWMKKYSAIGGAGSSLVKHQLSGIAREREWLLVPKLITESAAKLIGFKLGMHHKKLPKSIVRRISMHPLIWRQLSKARNEALSEAAASKEGK
ncbi:glycosyltransferase family 2 protein [Paenibacillus sp. HB172176]|uniref:glycosyltransferase family 2 protein n=1 Tax=Paenibacillus sp. HB172176 TaxID=2493690 RepID=UPI00143909E7|nr:glycosyltransferase family 2 protein [Paenibacillus sp. HB172176]